MFSIFACRSPHGERELKSVAYRHAIVSAGRSPHGERELKFDGLHLLVLRERVAPHTGSVS